MLRENFLFGTARRFRVPIGSASVANILAVYSRHYHFSTMPSTSCHSTLARQWTLLRKLPARPPGITAAELTVYLESEGFGTTKRTVERDLVELSRLFAIVCNDVSAPYGWHWMKGREPEIPDYDLPEALSICLAEEVLRASLPPSSLERFEAKFRRAKEKLNASRKTPLSRWRGKVRFVTPMQPVLAPKVRPEILRQVQQALMAERTITALYRPFDAPKAKRLTLNPLALVYSGQLLYLIATVFSYEQVRQFALHRFSSVVMGAEPARLPKKFDIDDYIASGAMGFGSPHPITLKARITENLARYLKETPLSRKQEITIQNGAIFLQAEVKDTWQLHWWILGQSPQMTILEPLDLAQRIHNALREALAHYEDRGN